MMTKTCHSCGDDGTELFRGMYYCEECYNELALGEIKCQNVTFFGGPRGLGEYQLDPSPWRENAVRAMEDYKD